MILTGFNRQLQAVLTIVLRRFTHVLQVERKRQEEKMRRDQLNDQYLDLIEKQRLYFKTVKEFKEECRKNEILLNRLRSG